MHYNCFLVLCFPFLFLLFFLGSLLIGLLVFMAFSQFWEMCFLQNSTQLQIHACILVGFIIYTIILFHVSFK